MRFQNVRYVLNEHEKLLKYIYYANSTSPIIDVSHLNFIS